MFDLIESLKKVNPISNRLIYFNVDLRQMLYSNIQITFSYYNKSVTFGF